MSSTLPSLCFLLLYYPSLDSSLSQNSFKKNNLEECVTLSENVHLNSVCVYMSELTSQHNESIALWVTWGRTCVWTSASWASTREHRLGSWICTLWEIQSSVLSHTTKFWKLAVKYIFTYGEKHGTPSFGSFSVEFREWIPILVFDILILQKHRMDHKLVR